MNKNWSTLRRFVKNKSEQERVSEIEILMNLALIAGIENLNPHRIQEYEINELANCVQIYDEEMKN